MSNSEEEDLILASNAVKHYLLGCTKREYSAHPIIVERNVFGEYHHLYKDLRLHPTKLYNYMRMKNETFDYILSRISDSL